MKKILLRVALLAFLIGGVVAIRQIVLDLSTSEDLWHPLTDSVDGA